MPPRLLDQDVLDAFERVLGRQPGGMLARMRPGLPEAEIRKALDVVGVAATDEAIRWWSWRDGSGIDVLPGLEHMSVASAAQQYERQRQRAVQAAAAGHGDQYLDDPDDWWRPGWLPIFYTGGQDAIAIDCGGPPEGPSPLRQIYWPSISDPDFAAPFAASLGEYIARAVDTLSTGRYRYDPKRDTWTPMDWARVRPGDWC